MELFKVWSSLEDEVVGFYSLCKMEIIIDDNVNFVLLFVKTVNTFYINLLLIPTWTVKFFFSPRTVKSSQPLWLINNSADYENTNLNRWDLWFYITLFDWTCILYIRNFVILIYQFNYLIWAKLVCDMSSKRLVSNGEARIWARGR